MQLLKIRYYQVKRDLGYWIVVIAAAVFYLAGQLDALKEPYPLLVPLVAVMFLVGYHVNRPDQNFIKKYFASSQKTILINYNLLVLPLTMGMVFSVGWFYALLIQVLVSLVAFTERKANGLKLLFVGRLIPPSQFEWISGLRSNLLAVVFLLVIALVLSPVKLFGLVALFLLNSILLGFYSYFEPIVMLNPDQLDKKSLLNRKINFFIKMVLLTSAPVLILNSVLHPEAISFNFFFLLGFILLAASTVYMKYAAYKPNQQQGFNVDALVLIASLFIPYLLPLSLFIYYNNRKKAIHNLSTYIDDHS